MWARIYAYRQSVKIAYDQPYQYFGTDDIGFKLLENGDYSNLNERFNQVPYIFKRSEIQYEIKTTPPQTLYLRNNVLEEDYEIKFKSTENMDTFLEFFPERKYDERITSRYYVLPSAESQSTSE